MLEYVVMWLCYIAMVTTVDIFDIFVTYIFK